MTSVDKPLLEYKSIQAKSLIGCVINNTVHNEHELMGARSKH